MIRFFAESIPGAVQIDGDKLIDNFVDGVLWILGALAVIMMIVGGLSITTAGGDPDKVKKGKTTLLSAVVGLMVVMLAGVIVNIVMIIGGS
jgi:vacuolar-type H+-ATPase subunit I/STV1